MYKILTKTEKAVNVNEYVLHAPLIAHSCLPGQFMMLRVDENGERLPFTVVDCDKAAGSITILVQTAGYSTAKLALKNAGEYIADAAGPLGKPTNLDGFSDIVLVGGGIGAAVIFPQAKRLLQEGRPAEVIIGAREKALIMYEKEFQALSKKLTVATDDGSCGVKGFVTDVLRTRLDAKKPDAVVAIGPLPMMRAVCELTRSYGVHTVVSMNSIMVDGTGMCGCCRVSVGGIVKYACVDGPEFDGHQVDFNEAIARGKAYRQIEAEHLCRLTGERR